jgi:SAM-dependent methyltransferase
LVLARHGAEVTVADLYLAEWDAPFHRKFYEAFLDKWTGEKTAIEKALRQDGYDGLLTVVREPAEHMPSIKSETFDFVQSHATLEHIMDISAAAADMARVTRPHGFHSHQGDFRDHRYYDEQPLSHLLFDHTSYGQFRAETKGWLGTAQRAPELIETFSRHFWIWKFEMTSFANDQHVKDVIDNLPPDSLYAGWPRKLLHATSDRFWFIRKKSDRAVVT